MEPATPLVRPQYTEPHQPGLPADFNDMADNKEDQSQTLQMTPVSYLVALTVY